MDKMIRVTELGETEAVCQDVEGNETSLPADICKLNKGDVLRLYADGSCETLYDCTMETACLFVTNQCNSNCVMCPDAEVMRKKPNNITIESLIEYACLLPSDLPHLDITGGEPTLLKGKLVDLCTAVCHHFERTQIMMLSNGRAFADQQFAQQFAEFSGADFTIEIPVHSEEETMHDYIAGCRGSFSQTMAGIQNLLHARVRVGIRIVVSALNYQCLNEIIRLIAQRFPQITFINIMGLEMMGNAYLNRTDVWVDFQHIRAALQSAVEECFRWGIEPRLYNFPRCLFEERFCTVYRKSISPHKIVFLEGCSECKDKENCGGFFFSTARITQFKGRGCAGAV